MEKSCLYCGVIFRANPKTKPRIYCSADCRQAYWFEHRTDKGLPSHRVAVCGYCGAEFDNLNAARKYCCHEHYIAKRFGKIPDGELSADELDSLVDTVLKLHGQRVSLQGISNQLGLPMGTIKRWIREYESQHLQDDSISLEMVRLEPQSEVEAQDIEVCELQSLGIRRAFLICGKARFMGKYDNFAAQVPQALLEHLVSGDIFVFCNKSRHQISVLQWQGDGFVLMFRRTEEERYPWPLFPDPKAVEVSRTDLEMLIEYPRLMRRLRGLATPELAA